MSGMSEAEQQVRSMFPKNAIGVDPVVDRLGRRGFGIWIMSICVAIEPTEVQAWERALAEVFAWNVML